MRLLPCTLYHSFPTLTYALEALSLNKTQIISIAHPWDRMFMKLFKTFNLTIVQQCQYYFKLLPVRHIYTLHGMSFVTKLENSNNILLRSIYDYAIENSSIISNLSDKYSCSDFEFVRSYETVVRKNLNRR